ncbi:MAG: hypothetical protein ACXADW_24015 [Candidatus Hodarchaeales archaeon]|jgi:hypothetical protein
MEKNCSNCEHYVGFWCPVLRNPTTEKGLCSEWAGQLKEQNNKKE